MFKTLQRSTIIRSLATVATALAIAAVGAAPASALVVWPVDNPMITGGDVQFGSGNGATPFAGGELSWNNVGGNVSPSLSGKIYVQNSIGKRVHMKIAYRDAWGTVITSRTSPYETVNTNPDTFILTDFMPFDAPNIYAVTVSTLRDNTPTVIGDADEELGSVHETIY
jgi:hypothetical protein